MYMPIMACEVDLDVDMSPAWSRRVPRDGAPEVIPREQPFISHGSGARGQ